MGTIGTIIGIIVVMNGDLSLLIFVNPDWYASFSDVAISSLVIGSGANTTNTVTKYFTAIKDRKRLGVEDVDKKESENTEN